MNFNINKKFFLYEVDPLFFYDSNNDGFGDFNGFSKKVDYFDYLDIDGIIFPDIFNQEEIILKNIKETIFDKYGSLNDLKTLVNVLNEKNKALFVEININNILYSLLLKTSISDMKNIEISNLIIEENDSNETKIKGFSNDKRVISFKKIIEFWIKAGVKNFIINDFEFIYQKNNLLDRNLLELLKQLYLEIKKINEDSIIGLKSLYFSPKTINNIFQNHLGVICDIFIDSSYSLIGTNKKYQFEIMKKFNHKKVLRKIRNIKIEKNNFSKYLISFNNNKIGRINSRWLNEENLIDESNKSLLMMLNMCPFSSVTYFGDEIGMLRLKIENINDYHDYEFIEKKRKLETKKFKATDFEKSQKFLSRINTQSIFIWNNKEENAGFSKAETIFRKLPINWYSHNLKDEFKNSDSILNFYKKLINFTKTNQSSIFDFASDIRICFSRKLLIIETRSNERNNMIIINLSNKTINKSLSNTKWKVILSTFTNKTYKSSIEIISPYESIILERVM